MALIRCPECGNSISDRAEKCPHCGLPASYFSSLSKNTPHMKEAGLDYKNLQNVLISFERDHAQLFSAEHYISHRDAQRLRDTYGKYNESLTNKLIFQYVCNNAAAIRVDIDLLRRFLRQMQSLDGDITAHNTTYVDRALERDKDYFDNMSMKECIPLDHLLVTKNTPPISIFHKGSTAFGWSTMHSARAAITACLPRSNGSVIFAPLVISVVFIRPIKLHCWKHGPSIRIGVLFWTI